jgi:hypothetical protein
MEDMVYVTKKEVRPIGDFYYGGLHKIVKDEI